MSTTGASLPGLDLGRLAGYLRTTLNPPPAGPLRGELITGGRSNLTYVITDGRTGWILRRPPAGPLLATAHDVAREHRVLSALAPTPIPVPRTYALCANTEVLGVPFLLMERMPGVAYRSRSELAALGPDRVRMIVMDLVDMLAELHRIDPGAVGLNDLGRPAGFLTRQVHRFRRQLEASRAREIAGIDALYDGLVRSVPNDGKPAILHGDYRLDNVLVDGTGRIRAVLDWEMATLGDPLTDLALLVARNRDMVGELGMLFDASAADGFPPTAEMIQRYATVSGRDVAGLDWYIALAHYKRAAILEGIRHRSVNGSLAAGPDETSAVVGRSIECGLAALARL